MSISGQILYSSPEPVVLEAMISIAAKLAGTQCPQALAMILMYTEMRELVYSDVYSIKKESPQKMSSKVL